MAEIILKDEHDMLRSGLGRLKVKLRHHRRQQRHRPRHARLFAREVRRSCAAIFRKPSRRASTF